jgi:hypothetical protein
MVQRPSGNWKVYQVLLPGADEILIPWAIPTPVYERIEAYADIHIPCSHNPPTPSPETPGQPYLLASPTCGEATDSEGNPGTTLTLIGRGFMPDTETEIWWTDPLGNDFRSRVEGQRVTVMTDEDGRFQIDVVIPYRLIPSTAVDEPAQWQVGAIQEIEVSEP